jgi:hypothetical protein
MRFAAQNHMAGASFIISGKKMQKLHFLFPGNKIFFKVRLISRACKQIASVAQRRSTGTTQRASVHVFKWVPERGPVARSNAALAVPSCRAEIR